MSLQDPYFEKKEHFGAKMAHLGPKILIFTGGSKSFGSNLTEKAPRHLVCMVGHGIKWAKNDVFGPKIHFLGVGSKNFGTHISGVQ